jgi:hypothetical protein
MWGGSDVSSSEAQRALLCTYNGQTQYKTNCFVMFSWHHAKKLGFLWVTWGISCCWYPTYLKRASCCVVSISLLHNLNRPQNISQKQINIHWHDMTYCGQWQPAQCQLIENARQNCAPKPRMGCISAKHGNLKQNTHDTCKYDNMYHNKLGNRIWDCMHWMYEFLRCLSCNYHMYTAIKDLSTFCLSLP